MRILDALRYKLNETSEPAIRRLVRRNRPYFAILPAPAPDARMVRGLAKAFPELTFVVDTGKRLPRKLPRLIDPLLPKLELEAEEKARAQYEDTRELLNETRPR